MVILPKDHQSDTSVSSELDELSFEEKRVQIFGKQMLQRRLFMGVFQEKRYVDSLNSYRDVVTLAKEEQELIQDLITVKQKIENLYTVDHWVGITTPNIVGAPAAYSIWVELPKNTTFGKYWFEIKKIKLCTKESCLRVKILRPVNQDTSKDNLENVNYHPNECPSFQSFEEIKEEAKVKLMYIIRNVITAANFAESIKFLCTLLATCVMLLFEVLRYFCEYLLRFMNEFSNFMKSLIPIFQIGANLIERLFRILCMLVAFLFKGQSVPAPPSQNNYPHINYGYYNARALPAPTRKRGVIIEEVQ